MKFSEMVAKLGDFVESSSLDLNPDCNPQLQGVAALDQATARDFSYVESGKYRQGFEATQAGALILPQDQGDFQARAAERGIAWIGVADARLGFAKVLEVFYQPYDPAAAIHPTATIAPDVVLGEGVYVGPHVVLEAGVTVGNFCKIMANTVLFPGVTVGDRTTIYSNVSVYPQTHIGQNCLIHAGVVLGADGFGFVPTAQGWYKMPQSGRVVIGDRVEIGANTAIDRPAVGETRIGDNCKFDNLVQLGHGVEVGDNSLFCSQVGIAGSTRVGKNVILAGQVGVNDHIHIDDGAIVTGKSAVYGDVKAGQVMSGNPAVENKLHLKISAISRRLPEIYQWFKQQQKRP